MGWALLRSLLFCRVSVPVSASSKVSLHDASCYIALFTPAKMASCKHVRFEDLGKRRGKTWIAWLCKMREVRCGPLPKTYAWTIGCVDGCVACVYGWCAWTDTGVDGRERERVKERERESATERATEVCIFRASLCLLDSDASSRPLGAGAATRTLRLS